MNSLKNLLVIVILVAGSCIVYYAVNRSPKTAEPTDEAPPYTAGPNIEMPPGSTPLGNPPSGLAPHYGQNGSPTAAAMQHDPNMPSPSGPGGYGGTTSPPAFVPPEDPPTPVDAQMGSVSGSPAYPAAPAQVGAPIASRHGATDSFEAAQSAIQAKLDQGLLADALLDLSQLKDQGQVPQEKMAEVQKLLDQLAGTVVYSRQHLMEEPYTVRPGDTLEQVAALYQVPSRLLANINGIHDPLHLEPGTQLKVVRGPFDAQIDLSDMELTLKVGGHYAGRFAIGVGEDQTNLEGTYDVSGKTVDPVYYAPDQTRIEASDPNNPLGELLISLGSGPNDAGLVAIHGTNDPRNLHHTGGRGTIRLGDRDIEDVFGILSIGSRVVIRR